MTKGSLVGAVDEARLAKDFERLVAALPRRKALIDAFVHFVQTAADDEVVRINAVRFGQERGFPTTAVVELFLHARKLGLVTMEWQYVCPGCGEIVERLTSLTSATAHYFCQVCSADRDADLSEYIEVTFSVAPELRRSWFHDPASLSAEDYFYRYRFSQTAVLDDGTPLSEHLRRTTLATAHIEPGATETFELNADRGYLWLTNGPALIVGGDRTDEIRSFAFEYTGVRSQGFRAEIAPGPVRIAFTNATADRYALLITMLPDHYDLRMRPFLSGAEVLSTQAFLDLFAEETIVAGEGLVVRHLALLFTDLQGSTALYERIGDLKAFDLVRQHFGQLRQVITSNSGALVKTIGDEVMASFVDPLDALRAAREMRDRITQFNREGGADLIAIKIGLHTGACLAVTLNERLDYFGQTVNIAARVQGLAGADEILVTDDVLDRPGARGLVADLPMEASRVELRGVAGSIGVRRIGPRSGPPPVATLAPEDVARIREATMSDEARREALIERIDGVRERWRRLVADVGPDRLEQPGAMGDWTFKDVAAHLTAWRRRTVDRLDAAARGAGEPPSPWPAELGSTEDDPINAWIHDQTNDRPASELLAEADAVYDDFIAAVRALPIDAVIDPQHFPWLGGSLADADFGGHLDEHEPSVRRWLRPA